MAMMELQNPLNPKLDELPPDVVSAVQAAECPHCGIGALRPAAGSDFGPTILLLICDHGQCGREVLMPTRRVAEKPRVDLTPEQRERVRKLRML